jgi:GPH family glycoside/pentoside/hexuronide:cation symporter
VIPLTVLPALALVPDSASARQSHHLRLRDAFRLLFNRAFFMNIAIVTTIYLAMGIYNSVVLILVEKELSLPGSFLWLVLFQYVVALGSVPAVLFCVRRFGGRDTICMSLVAFIAGLCTFAMSPAGAMPAAVIGFLFVGLAVSAIFIVLPVMVSNISAEYEANTGFDRLAEHLAIFNLAMKLSLAIGMGLGFLALQWLGYDPLKGASRMPTLSPPRLIGCLLPVAILVVSGVLATGAGQWRKIHSEMRSWLKPSNRQI